MVEREEIYTPQGDVQADDAYLGGEHPGGKAGRGSENSANTRNAISPPRHIASIVASVSPISCKLAQHRCHYRASFRAMAPCSGRIVLVRRETGKE